MHKAYFGQRLLMITLWGVGALLALHFIGQFIVRVIGTDSVFLDELIWRFNVDLELNVPTWYSSFLAALGSVSAFSLARYYRSAGKKRAMINAWLLIATGLLLIAIDETASFHELVLQSVHLHSGFGETPSYIENAWLIALPLIAVSLIIGLVVIYKQLPRQTFKNLAVAVGIYVLGAVVIEYFSIPYSDDTHFYNFVLTPLEEGLEMLGLWLVLRSIAVHVATFETALHARLKGLLKA